MEEMKLPHRLTLQERSSLTMTGVKEVLRFEEELVVLRTELGLLTVQGQKLHLRTLSLEGGELAVDGQITALGYQEPRPAGGALRRLFR